MQTGETSNRITVVVLVIQQDELQFDTISLRWQGQMSSFLTDINIA